jgi:hypothetical protein
LTCPDDEHPTMNLPSALLPTLALLDGLTCDS